MWTHGQAGTAEVGDQPLFGIHGAQRRFGIRLGKFVQQGPRVTHRALDLPESIAAMQFPMAELGTENLKLETEFKAPISASVFSSSLRNSGTRWMRS